MNAQEAEQPQGQAAEAAGPEIVAAATEAIRRAQAELKKAQEFYEDIRRRAAGQVEVLRNKKVGDLVDDALEAVKKHPASGLAIAASLGYLLGRLLRR